MEKKIKGAWLFQHSQKIQSTNNQDFDAIGFSGKCCSLLSAISSENSTKLSIKKINAYAKANQISPRSEVPSILKELSRQRLIEMAPDKKEIEIIGLTSQAVLEHTATIFDELEPEAHENAVIELSEMTSELPVKDIFASEFISDEFKLSKKEASSTLALAEKIGFFDVESISNTEKLIFNGNLFRREDAKKINGIINSLSQKEYSSFKELNEQLINYGCLALGSAKNILGSDLFSKLHSIGLFDVSSVENENGKNYFVTRPSAFSKFSNSIADDALDLAKAFVTSLTYGMTISPRSRGRIQMISALMNKLIIGKTVGPATAIGNDYQALESKGVVQVESENNGMFTMKLLKPDVGRLALSVIQEGDVVSENLPGLPGAPITKYINPEINREIQRKALLNQEIKVGHILNNIRTGGLSL